MKRKNDQSWKPLAHILSACGIPWIWYLADFIFSLLISMVTVRLPQMTGAIMQGEIFDKGLLADYVGITVFSMLLAFFSTVFGSWISLHTDRVLRKKIWEHFLYLPMTIYQTYKPSSLISRITQDTSGISYGISSCIGVLTNTWTIFLMLKNVYHMSPRMVAAMAVVIPWLILVSVVTGRFAFRASCRTQERFSDFTAVIAERLSNIRGIRIHGEELTELEKGREAARRQYEADLYQARVNLFSQPFIYTSEAFLKALFLIYGGFLISRGELESGEFITIYMYLEMLPVFAIQYIFAYQTLKETQGASMRAGQLLPRIYRRGTPWRRCARISGSRTFLSVMGTGLSYPVLRLRSRQEPPRPSWAPAARGKPRSFSCWSGFLFLMKAVSYWGKRRSGISA